MTAAAPPPLSCSRPNPSAQSRLLGNPTVPREGQTASERKRVEPILERNFRTRSVYLVAYTSVLLCVSACFSVRGSLIRWSLSLKHASSSTSRFKYSGPRAGPGGTEAGRESRCSDHTLATGIEFPAGELSRPPLTRAHSRMHATLRPNPAV